MRRAASLSMRAGAEDVLDVDRIKLIGAVAEVAPDFDIAPFGKDGANFFRAQRSQHADDTFPGATAAEKYRCRFEQADIVLCEYTLEDLLVRQRSQLGRLQRVRQELRA